jgi:glycosyltransferase involved in cell wall biosynthesis
MIYVVCPDYDVPSGGVRQLYRCVDQLNEYGRPARLLHRQPGFQCTWFAHHTAIGSLGQTAVQPSDVLVVPEIYGPNLVELAPGVPKVIYNQNAYNTFRGWPPGLPASRDPYRHQDVVAALVGSEDNREYLGYAYPCLPLFRVRYAIDPDRFAYTAVKEPWLAFMPRKHPEDAEQVFQLLAAREALGEFRPWPIDGCSEDEAATRLRRARVFLSFGSPEGFGLPAAEAMACGAVVVGYHGGGGREFLTADRGFPVALGEIVQYARTVEAIIRSCRDDPVGMATRSGHASQWVHDHYSPEQATRDLLGAWEAIENILAARGARPGASPG